MQSMPVVSSNQFKGSGRISHILIDFFVNILQLHNLNDRISLQIYCARKLRHMESVNPLV